MATILIIDDDAEVRANIIQALKAAGHQVFSAANGKEGMRHFEAIRPDLVFIGVFMPEQDGLETITDLQRRFPAVPVLAISGGNVASPAILSVVLQLGAAKVLEKPFDKDTLLAIVERTLQSGRRRAKRDLFGDVHTGPILPESH